MQLASVTSLHRVVWAIGKLTSYTLLIKTIVDEQGDYIFLSTREVTDGK